MGPEMSAPISLSAIDQARFGMVVARSAAFTARSLPDVLSFCRDHTVRMLVARCDASDFAAIHAIEAAGGRLMDVLVYYARHLSGRVELPEPRHAVRPGLPADASAVRWVAAESFRGYGGHYHADPRLDRAKCDETYADWAHRSCVSREVADRVFVAEDAGRVVGFLTLRHNSPVEDEVPLNAVLPSHQRGGVYRSLMAGALASSRDRGVERLIISTQMTNVPVQKAWVRMGFEPSRSHFTFHLWFDP